MISYPSLLQHVWIPHETLSTIQLSLNYGMRERERERNKPKLFLKSQNVYFTLHSAISTHALLRESHLKQPQKQEGSPHPVQIGADHSLTRRMRIDLIQSTKIILSVKLKYIVLKKRRIQRM